MSNISVVPTKRSLLYIICICSRKQKPLRQPHLQKRRKRNIVPHLQQKPKQKAYHRRKRISWHFSEMIQKCNRWFYKKSSKIIRMTTLPALQHHHPHQNQRIFKILRIPMNCNQRRQELVSWQNTKSTKTPCKRQMTFGKSKGHFLLTVYSFAGKTNLSAQLLKTKYCAATGRALLFKSKNNGIHFRRLLAKADSHCPRRLTKRQSSNE